MIKSGIREALEMFDLLRDSACVIDHYTEYINHCQDPQLRQILESQQRRMIEGYQQKAGAMQGHGLDLTNIPRFQSAVYTQGTAAAGIFGGANIQFGPQQPGTMQGQQQVQPQFQAQAQHQVQQQMRQWPSGVLNDRTIAQGALLFHKCGATRATAAALESAEPHLRNLAANSARACMEMAYEIFRYMDQKGWYQMPETPRNYVSHAQEAGAQVYPGMQPGYQAGVQGIPGQLS